MKTTQDLKEYLDQKQMSKYQWLIISICILIYTIDGFDIMVMAFTAHSISLSWELNGAQIGSLISSGLIGTAIGSFFVAPLGDKIGRKHTIVISLVFASLCMIISAYTQQMIELLILRFITGIAIGGVLSNCNVLTNEYSSRKWNSLTICLLSTGYALGATFGGLISLYFEQHFGWHSVFLVGGVLSFITVVITIIWVPESLYFLINKQPKKFQEQIIKIQQQLHIPNLSQIQKTEIDITQQKNNFASIFKNGLFVPTILLWLALFTMMFGFYYILTWTPKILSGNGLSNAQGISAGVLINLGAVIGTLAFGLLGAKFKIKQLQVIFLLGTAILTVLFAYSLKNIELALIIGLVVGVFGVGSKAGIQVVAPMIYDASNRATGVGLAIGIGRLGSMLSPLIAGFLLDAGWSAKSLFIFASLFFIISMFALILLPKKKDKEPLSSSSFSTVKQTN